MSDFEKVRFGLGRLEEPRTEGSKRLGTLDLMLTTAEVVRAPVLGKNSDKIVRPTREGTAIHMARYAVYVCLQEQLRTGGEVEYELRDGGGSIDVGEVLEKARTRHRAYEGANPDAAYWMTEASYYYTKYSTTFDGPEPTREDAVLMGYGAAIIEEEQQVRSQQAT